MAMAITTPRIVKVRLGRKVHRVNQGALLRFRHHRHRLLRVSVVRQAQQVQRVRQVLTV